MRRYLRILQAPGAGWPFASALLARLPISMLPLGVVLLVEHVYGSYAQAGSVAAAFTLGSAAATPFWGRLIDRVGIGWVLGPLGMISGALLAVLAVGAVRAVAVPILVALAVAVGASFPPVGATTRGTWRVVLTDSTDLQLAYALDGVVVEAIYVAGPLLISLMLAVGPPALPLLVTALLLTLGCLAYVATPAVRSWRGRPHGTEAARGSSPLRIPGVLAAVAVALVIAVAFGNLDVALAAIAKLLLGDPAKVGLLFGAIAGGSAVGGILYGARAWPMTEAQRVPFVVGTFACGLLALAASLQWARPDLIWLLPLMFATGMAVAPALIMLANLVDQHAPTDRLSEAQAWLTTAYTSGGAAGTAMAGFVIDRAGIAWAVFEAAIGLAVAAVIAVVAQRFWRGMSRAATSARS